MHVQMKENIRRLRLDGLPYSAIAKATGIPINTVKAHCRRNGIGKTGLQGSLEEGGNYCKQCGKQLPCKTKGKPKKFCCDKCRYEWWNSHRHQLNRKASYLLTCAYCEKEFISYGNKDRKYCGHNCYIIDRFGSLYGQAYETPCRKEG